MKLSLEKINKGLLFVALASLIYREGNFSSSLIPKLFEILFVVLFLTTAIYLLKDSKIKDFFLSIPKKIWIASLILTGSIFLGWSVAILDRMPSAPISNMLLELGTFSIGLILFLLILFYTKDDENYSRYYLYALLLPVVYIILIFYHPLAIYLGMNTNQHFLGFTVNPNTVSKILLIPAIFFISYSLFESKNSWLKVLYIFISSSLVSLILWTASRGALVSLAAGVIFILAIYVFHEFNWRKIFFGAGIVAIILFLGFKMVPYTRQKAVVQRIVATVVAQRNIFTAIGKGGGTTVVNVSPSKNSENVTSSDSAEPRLIIWPFYIKYVFLHPLGIGPDTHKGFGLTDNNGIPLNSGPHNTYLQIWLWGGALGLLSFLFILFSAFKNLKMKLQSSFTILNVALLAILFTLSIVIFFDDSLSFYWFFIILALAIRNQIPEKNQENSGIRN